GGHAPSALSPPYKTRSSAPMPKHGRYAAPRLRASLAHPTIFTDLARWRRRHASGTITRRAAMGRGLLRGPARIDAAVTADAAHRCLTAPQAGKAAIGRLIAVPGAIGIRLRRRRLEHGRRQDGDAECDDHLIHDNPPVVQPAIRRVG